MIPSSAEKAYRLLLASIHAPSPVIFLEPTRLYRKQKDAFIPDGREYPLGGATVKTGTDIS